MLALPCAYSFPPNSRFLFLPLSPFLCDQRGGMRVELGRKYHLHWHHSFGWNAKSLQSIHITFMLFMSYLVSRVLLSVVYRFSNIDITKYHIDTSFQFLFPSFMALHWQLTRTYEDVTCVRKRNDYSLKKRAWQYDWIYQNSHRRSSKIYIVFNEMWIQPEIWRLFQ